MAVPPAGAPEAPDQLGGEDGLLIFLAVVVVWSVATHAGRHIWMAWGRERGSSAAFPYDE